jgi:ankyrin repeat protein
MVDFLLEKGASPNGKERGSYGYSYYSPLYMAVQQNNKEIVAALVAKGADPFATIRNEGQSPFQYAIGNGRRDLVEAMLAKNVDVNTKDRRGMTILHTAVTSSSYGADMVDLLIEKGADPNARNGAGLTPLHLAAQSGNGSVVGTLVRRKGDLTAKTRMGDTPLHLAATRPDVGMALLEAGADPNVRNARGDLPLHLALRTNGSDAGREAAVNFRMALVNKTDINAKDQFGFTPLQLAILWRQLSVRDAILARKPKLDSTTAFFDAAARNDTTELTKLLAEKPYLPFLRLPNGVTAMHVAAQWGAKDAVELLTKKYAEINARDAEAVTPLLRLVRLETGPANADVVEMANFLITKGADPKTLDESDSGGLHAAVRRGSKDLAQLLLAKGADPNVRNKAGQAPLDLLVPGEYESQRFTPTATGVATPDKSALRDIAALLIEKGADISQPDSNGSTLLTRAAGARNKEMVSLLIEKGADVNAKNNNGETALMRVVNNSGYSTTNPGVLDIVRLLLDKGADVNSKTQYGDSVLNRALSNSNVELAKLFIEKGADLSNPGQSEAPLMRIISMGNKELLALAIEKKADINAKDASGSTPLMRAAMSGNKDIVQLLLDAGADVNAKAQSGHTVLDFAARGRNNDLIELLKARGAKESGLKTPLGGGRGMVVD